MYFEYITYRYVLVTQRVFSYFLVCVSKLGECSFHRYYCECVFYILMRLC